MTVYVAVAGNDAWSGTQAQANAAGTDGPFRTLQRARDALRQAPAGEARVILVREGVHHLDAPLLLGPEDSGTAAQPLVIRAAEGERVVLSGGRPIVGWQRREGGLWAAPVPEAKEGRWDFRQLRLGDALQTLARHPNLDPADPLKRGWLFAREPAGPERAWQVTVSNIHTPGDWIAWDVDVPRAGDYAAWVCYGQLMKPHGRTEMDGRTVFQVDDGPDVPLLNLPDTGGWSTFAWSRSATLALSAGRHRIRWTNRLGGGINFNALALCSDPAWKAVGLPPTPPAAAAVLLTVQAEAYAEAKGREMRVDRGAAPGRRDELWFGPGDIPEGDVAGGQIMVFPAWGWVGGPVQVAGIDRGRGVLQLGGPNASQDIRLGNRYFLENLRWALDQPGEFFLDRQAGEVLLIPKEADFAGAGVVAPRLDRLIEISGSAEPGTWPEHIRIEGMAFRDTTYSLEVDSLYSPDDAAIRIDHARQVTVEDCTFSHLGGYAVRLALQANGCRVLRCAMSEMGQGGVITRGDTASQPFDCTVAGCTMQALGRVYKHVAGVYVTTGRAIRVAYNTIHDVPRYAISFKSYNAEAASHDCIAEFNDIRRTNLETNDTGAIETLGRDRQPSGNVIRGNLILDTIGMKHTDEGGLITPFYTWGIYLDDFSSGTTVTGNIVARNVRGGYHNHLGFDNVVENNIFVNGANQQAEWNGGAEMRRNVYRRNLVVYSSPEAAYLKSGGWAPEVLKECNDNLVWWTGGDLAGTDRAVTPAGTWAQWQALGFDTRSKLADPGFADAAADDYRLSPASPAWALGFQPIPVERIGVQGYQP